MSHLQAARAAIEEARKSGDLGPGKAPVVIYRTEGGQASTRVCRYCLTEPTWEDSACHSCELRAFWHKFCPDEYRAHDRLEELGDGPDPWTADEIGRLNAWLDADPFAPTLGLISPQPGRRKTTAAFAVVKAMLSEEMRPVKYTRASNMLRDLQARRFDQEAIEEYTTPEILLLDELGDRDDSLSEDRRALLQDVIEERYAWRRPLIWTSNLPLKDLRSWCHPRTWERLWANGVVLQISGKSSRRMAA